jgi:hypothetical protein
MEQDGFAAFHKFVADLFPTMRNAGSEDDVHPESAPKVGTVR